MNLDRLKEKIKQGRLSIDALHNIDFALCKEKEAVKTSGLFWLFQCVGVGCSQGCVGDACSQGCTSAGCASSSCAGHACTLSSTNA